MRYSEWREVELGKVIEFNPTENLKIGIKARKIAMDKLNTFDREIQGFEIAEFSGGTKFRNGDTLLARITPCLENGKTAQVRILEKDEIAFGSTEFIVMREKPNETVNDFIYYLSISDYFRNIAIKSMSGTSGRQRAQKDVLEKTIIKLPSVKVQMDIAYILSTLDDKIEKNNSINENLQSISQLLFKHWFVDFEFENEEGLPYKSSGGQMVDSELGMIPKGWEVKELGCLCNITSSKRIFMNEYVETGIPFYRSKEIIQKSKGTAISTELFISFEKYDEIREKFSIPQKGDILLTSVGTLGVAYKVEDEKFYFKDGNLTWFKDYTRKEYINYIYLWLLSEVGKGSLDSITIGSTQKALTISSLKKLKLVCAYDLLLEKFESVASNLLDKICLNNKENESLINLRDNLLPKLMNGEIDLSNLEVNL